MMSPVVQLLLVLLSGEAYQTDWSGGPGVHGPVQGWDDSFSACSSTSFRSPGGEILLGIHPLPVEERWIVGGMDYPRKVLCCDIDDDGDVDLLFGDSGRDHIRLLLNADGQGDEWFVFILDPDCRVPADLECGDVDSDGDMDILAANGGDGDLAWYENVDGPGLLWVKHIIAGKYYACEVGCTDLDLDGDLDVYGASAGDRWVTWWENPDGTGQGWIHHHVDDYVQSPVGILHRDMDGDGDTDLVGASTRWNSEKYAVWWRNEDGAGTDWTEMPVFYTDGRIHSMECTDLDCDGDPDLVFPDFDEYRLWTLYNADGLGTTWEARCIDSTLFQPKEAVAADFDRDGDPDLFVIDDSDECNLYLYVNCGGNPVEWVRHDIAEFSFPYALDTGDISGNGITDVVACSITEDEARWWRMAHYDSAGWLESAILDTCEQPGWSAMDWVSDEPVDTGMSLRIRTSDDPDCMGEWSGPYSCPGQVPGGLDRYVQYRAELWSDGSESSPAVYDVGFSWDPTPVDRDGVAPVSSRLSMSVAGNPARGPVELQITALCSGSCEIRAYGIDGRLVLRLRMYLDAGRRASTTMELPTGLWLLTATLGDDRVLKAVVVL